MFVIILNSNYDKYINAVYEFVIWVSEFVSGSWRICADDILRAIVDVTNTIATDCGKNSQQIKIQSKKWSISITDG